MKMMDTIRKLAANATDLALSKIETKRIGAEAERRSLFIAYMRDATAETLTGDLRDRAALFAHVTDDELKAEFQRRALHDEQTEATTRIVDADAELERMRVEAERVGKLVRGAIGQLEKI